MLACKSGCWPAKSSYCFPQTHQIHDKILQKSTPTFSDLFLKHQILSNSSLLDHTVSREAKELPDYLSPEEVAAERRGKWHNMQRKSLGIVWKTSGIEGFA